MDIEKSYSGLAWFFNCWSIYVEGQFRAAEIQDSHINKSKILIISPPTDSGIGLFARANAKGETYLICFSAVLEKIARCYCQKQRITGLETCTAAFFGIPFADAHFDVIIANCFFDFCRELDFDKIIREIKRV